MLRGKFKFLLSLITILALLIRLRGFDNHFLLSSDTARDILTARAAVLLHQLPLVGSFSSAGPFVFGPNWYWQLMIPQMLFPNIFLGPWILMLGISLLLVVIMGYCGKLLGGNKLGLITGLMTAISPAAIGFSSYATQHAMVEIFSGLTLLGFLSYIKTKKMVFAFLMAVSVGGAISYHYQALNLVPYYLLILVWHVRNNKSLADNLKLISVLTVGSVLFLLPILLWDSTRGFSNTLHLIGYFRVGQYQFYVPNRWLTYLFSFWPDFVGKLVGGSFQLGSLFGGLALLVFAFQFLRRRFSPMLIVLLTVFGIQFMMMRYFRGERYDGYLVFFHPIVLLLISYTVDILMVHNRKIGFVALLVVIVLSIKAIMPVLDWDNGARQLAMTNSALKQIFPGQKFSLYGRDLTASNIAYSQSLILEKDYLGDDNGRLIGICLYDLNNCKVKGAEEIIRNEFQGQPFVVIDLAGVDRDKLTKKNDWYSFSKLGVYDDVQNWWRKE